MKPIDKLLKELNKIDREEKELSKKYCPHGWRMDSLEYCDKCTLKRQGERK